MRWLKIATGDSVRAGHSSIAAAAKEHSLGLIVDISTEIQKEPGHVQVIFEGGNIQRCSVVPKSASQFMSAIRQITAIQEHAAWWLRVRNPPFLLVHVGAMFQKKLCYVNVIVRRGVMKRRFAFAVRRCQNELPSAIKLWESAGARFVTKCSCLHRIFTDTSTALKQQLRKFHVIFDRSDVKRGLALSAVASQKIVQE